MKVVIISNDFRVYWKGRLIYLQNYLATQGISFYAIELFGKGSPYSFDGYENKGIWWTCLFPEQSAAELSKHQIKESLFEALTQLKPDIVITSPITFFSGALGLNWAKKHRKKIIMFDDAKPLIQFKRNPVVQWVKDRLIKQTDALWLPSADYDAEYPSINKQNVLFFYGYSCIDNDFFKPVEPKRLNNKAIICVARLVPVKNIDTLLSAWQLIEQKRTDYRLIIIGDGPLYGELTALQKKLSLQNVEFAGSINNREIAAWYANADAFILPSLTETWGLVVNEAMASGLPVLLSDKINASSSLLKEGVNGYGFSPVIVNEIHNALINYINLSLEIKRGMSDQSLQIIADMSYEQMGIQLSAALKDLNSRKFRKTNLISSLIRNRWFGKHDTYSWDYKN